MSTKYKNSEEVPLLEICKRLDELSDAVTKGRQAISREFSMRVFVEVDRDADIALHRASMLLLKQNAQIIDLLNELNNLKELKFTIDGALAECPCCGSLDVGGLGGSIFGVVNCNTCRLEIRRPTLKAACEAWNKRKNQ